MTVSWVRPPSELRIGRYVVESKLGEGGMAETWLCRLAGPEGASSSEHVVIKTMRPECSNPEFETMFADEARIGARLEHPNIPRILEFGQTPRGPFMVQEYVDGPSVVQILRRQSAIGVPNLRLGARIVADIAGALDAAWHSVDEHGHPLRVVHRDVSPSNVLVSRRGTPKLIDFGVAMFEDRETQTEAGVLKGKLRYMAPEVLLHGDISHQADLYSLGIVLYSLCYGEPPWGSPPSRPIDPALAAIVSRALHADRAQRFATGRELELALEGWLERNGGPMTEADVADRLVVLFPEGSSHWRPSRSHGGTSSTLGLVRHRPAPPPTRHGRWLLAATVLLFLATSTLVVAVGAAAWIVVEATRADTAKVEPEPEIHDAALAAEPAEPSIDDELDAIRALVPIDPTAARERLAALIEAHPDLAASPDAVALAAEIAAELQPVPEQVVEPVPVAASPPVLRSRTSQKPTAPPSDLLGERTGRAPAAPPPEP